MVANYMSLTVSQLTNGSGFPKAAELIEITGTHALEASDRAIFNHLLQTAHDSGRLAEADAEWEVSLAALRRPASKHESNDRIRESLRRLRRTEVKVSYVSVRTGKRRTMETHLLEFTDTDDDEGEAATLQFGIPRRLRVILARSNRWGRIRCEVAYAMTSKYAIALYEKVCLWANLDNCVRTMGVAEFRDMLGVPPGAYERGLDFERKVIEPAVLEVNGLSDMGVQIQAQRRHARAPIHGITLSWWKKDGDEFRAAMQERNRSKVGRMARLKGTAEKISAAQVTNAVVADALEQMRAKE
jgi:hypothetical protein